jgi:hypothetical protein
MDEGVQILENLANIRVPVIAAIDGRAHVHSEYALLVNVIVAGEGATFNDLPHFAGGIVPGDGASALPFDTTSVTTPIRAQSGRLGVVDLAANAFALPAPARNSRQ